MTSDIPATSGVYRITCTTSGKFYIGSAINLHNRKRQHFKALSQNSHYNQKMQHAWNKYGEQSFIFEVLELVLPISLTAREQYWFNKLQPFGDKGFNISPTAGSTLGREFSLESRKKMSISRTGKKQTEEHKRNAAARRVGRKHTSETRAKMSAAHIGNTRNLGRKPSPDSIEKSRIARTGQKRSEETRRKMSAWQTGRTLPAETREKISKANRGRKHTPDEIAKMSAIGKITKVNEMKTLIVTDPDGNTSIVTGIRQFCAEHHLDRSAILRVAKGQQRHHKGWKAHFPETGTG